MKISKATVDILKNFSRICKSILVPVGSEIRIWNPDSRQLIGIYECEEKFESEFSIFDLTKFLNSLNLFYNQKEKTYDVELTFNDEHTLVLSNRNIKLNYTLQSPDCIKSVSYEHKYNPSNIDATFEIQSNNLSLLLKSASILTAPHISIFGDGENLFIKSHNKELPNSDSFVLNVGNTDKVFDEVYNSENFIFPEGDYTIDVLFSNKKAIVVKNKSIPLRYIVNGIVA